MCVPRRTICVQCPAYHVRRRELVMLLLLVLSAVWFVLVVLLSVKSWTRQVIPFGVDE